MTNSYILTKGIRIELKWETTTAIKDDIVLKSKDVWYLVPKNYS